MKTKTIVIFGDITFNDFNSEELIIFKNPDAKQKALVHEINGIVQCDSVKQAEEIGECYVNIFGSYIVPALFDGEILYEPDSRKNLSEIFGELK